MKHGFRKPSFRKSLAARTVGKAKRQLLKELIPGYGTKGMGVIHPVRSAYNKLYSQTTFGINDLKKTHYENTSKNYNTVVSKSIEEKSVDSYAKKIYTEIQKINKKDDFSFFSYLNYLYASIDSLKAFETEYGVNHIKSDELLYYIESNKDKFINEYLFRYYNKVANKIKLLKTYDAKLSNLTKFEYTMNSNKELFNEENQKNAEKYCSELMKILNENP